MISESSTKHASKKLAVVACESTWARCLVIALLIISSSELVAQDAPVNTAISFDIPQQRADLSLIVFAEQADRTLLFPFDVAKEKTANGLFGAYSTEEGLERLLAGTGLNIAIGEQGELSIVPDTPQEGESVMKNSKPRKSFIAAIAAALVAPFTQPVQPVAAQEVEEIEEVIVTGSRIRRAVEDSPSPITTFDRMDLDLAGSVNVADVLRSTVYNSIGSLVDHSNIDAGAVAVIDLRGLGPDRTAVLINGRRVPGNPFTGTAAVDLNAIPMAAIERIEILTDSASAIYGADAIGGVINIILRDDFAGFSAQIGAEFPTQEGGEAQHANFTFGAQGEKTSILFTGEYFDRERIFAGTRSYTKSTINFPSDGSLPIFGVDTQGVWSSAGNTAIHPDGAQVGPIGDCEAFITPSVTQPTLVAQPPNGTFCAYGFDQMSLAADLDRISTVLVADYEFSPGQEIYFENRYTRLKTGSNFAPAAGRSSLDATFADNPFDITDPAYPRDPVTNEPLPITVRHRFVSLGTRDEFGSTSEIDNVLGVRGSFNDGAINYDAYVRSYRYEATMINRNYALTSQFSAEVLAGTYDIADPFSLDPVHVAANERIRATLSRDPLTKYAEARVTLDGQAWELPSGAIGWAAGFEIANEAYRDTVDAARDAGNTLGSSTGSAGPVDRDRSALFGELSFPVLDNLTVNVAGRYDDYDAFSGEFSPQISARFQPFEPLVIRASWGEGFKAPNLREVSQPPSLDFGQEFTDVLRCDALMIAPCPSASTTEQTGGNPNLEPETSESFNVGVVVDPLPGLSLSVDWYTIDIENLVDSLSIDTLLILERDGIPLPSGVRLDRGAPIQPGDPGLLILVLNGFGNFAAREVEGLDFRGYYTFDLNDGAWGSLAFDLKLSHLLEYSQTASPVAPAIDRLGSQYFPEDRWTFTTRWQRGPLTLNLAWNHIGEHAGATGIGTYPEWDGYDFVGVYATPWNGEIVVGVENLTDQDPSIDSAGSFAWRTDMRMYDIRGRVPYVTYRHNF